MIFVLYGCFVDSMFHFEWSKYLWENVYIYILIFYVSADIAQHIGCILY